MPYLKKINMIIKYYTAEKCTSILTIVLFFNAKNS